MAYRSTYRTAYRPSNKASSEKMAKIQLAIFAMGCFAVFILFVIFQVIPSFTS